MVALPVIGSISAILFIGAALLIILWKREFSGVNQKLIVRIGISVLLVGVYNLAKIIISSVIVSDLTALVSIIELVGFTVLMFSLFSWLEETK